MQRPIRLTMVGLRGFPGVQGGVEAHAEHLCPLLAELGCDVTVLTRSPYQAKEVGESWRGVRFVRLWAPRSKTLEAPLHTLFGVLYAGLVQRPDILHIHAIGPALTTPLARALGLRVVVTHHGFAYEWQKWGRLARSVLRIGESYGMRWANRRVVISRIVEDLVRAKYGLDSDLIPNGVDLPQRAESTAALQRFGLTPGRYVLLVGRLVPEKRHIDLIRAFARAELPGWKLALVGASDHPDDYSRSVIQLVRATPGIVATGFQTGLALQELYTHAGMFVLPSSHEGLPIALLEALSYGLPVLASDIAANIEIGLAADRYFPLGDVDRLAVRIAEVAATPPNDASREAGRRWVTSRYDWRDIAMRTQRVYEAAMGRVATRRGGPLPQQSSDHGAHLRSDEVP